MIEKITATNYFEELYEIYSEDTSIEIKYKGSQRDIIIISFAINNPYQLNAIINTNDDSTVDRKLNVALVRAKEQLVLIGNDSILSNNLIYYKLIEFIKLKGGYIYEEILNDNLHFNYFYSDETIEGETYTPDKEFKLGFDKFITDTLKNDYRTIDEINKSGKQWFKVLLGRYRDFIRNNVIEYGRTDFDSPCLVAPEMSPIDKVNLYCF